MVHLVFIISLYCLLLLSAWEVRDPAYLIQIPHIYTDWRLIIGHIFERCFVLLLKRSLTSIKELFPVVLWRCGMELVIGWFELIWMVDFIIEGLL